MLQRCSPSTPYSWGWRRRNFLLLSIKEAYPTETCKEFPGGYQEYSPLPAEDAVCLLLDEHIPRKCGMFGWGKWGMPAHLWWAGWQRCHRVFSRHPSRERWCYIHVRSGGLGRNGSALVLQIHQPLPLGEWVHPGVSHVVDRVRVSLGCRIAAWLRATDHSTTVDAQVGIPTFVP